MKRKNILRRLFSNINLLSQIEIILFLGILLVMVVNNYISNKHYEELIIQNLKDDYLHVSYNIKAEMETTYNIEWLVNYWTENYENMILPYDDPDVIAKKTDEFLAENPGIDLYSMSAEQIAALSDNSRRLYAEIEYFELVEFIDEIKQIYRPKYVFVFNYIGDDMAFYYFSGAEKGDKRGSDDYDVYCLGSVKPMRINEYPVLNEMLKNSNYVYKQKDVTNLDEHNGRYHLWLPVEGESGNVIAYIGLSLEPNETNNMIANIKLKQNLTGIAIFIISSILLVAMVNVIVLTPLGKLKNIVDNYSAHKDSKKLEEGVQEIASKNELGLLADSFMNMAFSIDEYTDEVRKLATEQERISADLHIAADIQASMLPETSLVFPKMKEFDLSASMDPAREVGGDFYDFFQIDDDNIGLVMADVSGKGMPAALLMTVARTIIRNRLKTGESPKEVLYNANNQFMEDDDLGYFVTVWLGKFELSTGRLVTANAGHEYPLVKRNGGKFEVIKDKHSAALGAFDDTEYYEEIMELNPGDKLFIYTDGVPEANKGDDNLYGLERVLDSLNGLAERSCDEIIGGIKANLNAFIGNAPQFDDITMMCFEYKGK